MKIAKTDITGLVLAGGRGSRMGGVDKGLQDYRGLPLARHALLRLAPQVGGVMINANRNLPVYRSMGIPVWPDEIDIHHMQALPSALGRRKVAAAVGRKGNPLSIWGPGRTEIAAVGLNQVHIR